MHTVDPYEAEGAYKTYYMHSPIYWGMDIVAHINLQT